MYEKGVVLSWFYPIDLSFVDPWDANNLPDTEPDYIFSSHCLEHVDDWVETLLYWTKRLRSGGLFSYTFLTMIKSIGDLGTIESTNMHSTQR